MAGVLPSSIPVLPVLHGLHRARLGDRRSAENVARAQSSLLGSLVRHALTSVPYYRERYAGATTAISSAEDLAALPIIDRRDLHDLGSAPFTADGFSSANTRAASTSGSSGTPVELLFSEHDLGYLRATFLWDMLASGMRPHDRVGYFRVGGFRRHRLEKLGLARNVHVNTSLGLDQQVEAFLTGRPTFLYGFPNAIVALVEELRRRRVSYDGVHDVLFAGEKLPDPARDEVLSFLGARGHEAYASVEAYTIARSCPRGALHLRSSDVVVEVEHDDGATSVADGEGEIVITRLHAQAMPLLRYRLGDRVAIVPNDCSCGVRSTPVVASIMGRSEDRVVTRDGRSRSADYLFSLLNPVRGVQKTQFQQSRPGAVEVLVVPGPGAPETLERDVLAALAPTSDDFTISARLVTTIPAGANGKIQVVKRLPTASGNASGPGRGGRVAGP
ncbi:MAG: hypothetical protein L0H93_06560 [Nocardioides sp.]|nr:hypothetical protein [Nocardioides sp.]